MDVVTKILLINFICIISVLGIDRGLLSDGLEDTFPKSLGWWTILSVVSVPAYLIYLIV